LDSVAKNHWVSEQVAALERVLSDTNTFWIDAHHRGAIVLLQDRVHNVGESVDGCQRSLTTMFSVMLPRNPPLENFDQLLEVLRTSRRIHRLIELNLIAGANFALGWVRKWHPRVNLVLCLWVCLLHSDPDLWHCRFIWMLHFSLQEG
jgi:hypothetical protein